jgi:hypothetical protein
MSENFILMTKLYYNFINFKFEKVLLQWQNSNTSVINWEGKLKTTYWTCHTRFCIGKVTSYHNEETEEINEYETGTVATGTTGAHTVQEAHAAVLTQLTPNEVAAFPTVLKLQSVASKALKAKYSPIRTWWYNFAKN